MGTAYSTVAHQIAQAALAFEEQRTGQVARAVNVVLGGETVVITLHGVLSPAEKALARTRAGAAQVQEFHRELFTSACGVLQEEIQRITGMEVREAAVELEPESGMVVQVFTSGTLVQVFLLAGSVPTGTWSEMGQAVRDPCPGSTGWS